MSSRRTLFFIWLICFKPRETTFNVSRFEPLLRQHCPFTKFCSNKAPLARRPPPSWYQICCRSCSCDSTCGASLSCCTETQDSYNLISKLKMKCIDTKPNIPLKINLGFVHFKYWMIDTCPAASLPEYVSKCMSSNTTIFGSVWPVYSNTTGLLYKNQFCAFCNNDDATEFWNPTVFCKEAKLDVIGTIDDVTFEMRPPDDSCYVALRPTRGVDVTRFECYAQIIKECNVTGLWKAYDPIVEEGCLSITAPYNTRYGVYANSFCFICNTGNEIDFDLRTYCGQMSLSFRSPVSFQALLTFKRPSARGEIAEGICNNGQFYDPFKGKCSELHCPESFKRINDVCYPNLIPAKEIYYTILLEIARVPTDVTSPISQATNDFAIRLEPVTFNGEHMNQWKEKLLEVVAGEPLYSICMATLYFHRNNITRVVDIPHMLLLLYLAPTETFTTQVSTRYAMKSALSKSFTISNPKPAKYQINIYSSTIDDFLPNTIPKTDYYCLHHTYYAGYCEQGIFDSYCILQAHANKIALRKTNLCNIVTLDTADYSYNGSNLYLKRTGDYLGDAEFAVVTHENGAQEVRICIEDYLSLNFSRSSPTKKHPLGYRSLPAVLSLASGLVSIACIAVTLILYGILEELRTFPGKLNIILLSNLLLAQGALTFGVGETDIKSLCIAIGLLVHFCWLSAMFWMTASCIHMFGVFCQIRSLTDHADWKKTVWYACGCYGAATSFVVANVVVAGAGSSAGDLGYGPDLCYINSTQMLTFTFALPVGVAVLANLVLYVCVAYKIYDTKNDTRLVDNERSYIGYCVRLSSITGLTWVFGFLFELTGFWILEYLFAGLGSLQGLFIMLSFVCTRKTLNLCKSKLQAGFTEESHQVIHGEISGN